MWVKAIRVAGHEDLPICLESDTERLVVLVLCPIICYSTPFTKPFIQCPVCIISSHENIVTSAVVGSPHYYYLPVRLDCERCPITWCWTDVTPINLKSPLTKRTI